MKKANRRQAEEIENLTKMREEEIDTTDIPEITDSFLSYVGKFYRPIKKSATVRLDVDVITWLKSKGRGYQTRVNQILRTAMENQRHKKAV